MNVFRYAPTLIGAASIPAAILALSAAALMIAFGSQYWGGLAPCDLCIYQRYPYGIAIALSAAALAVPRTSPGRALLMGLCALAFAVDSGIAIYHVGVEEGVFAGPTACSGGAAAAALDELRARLEATAIVRCEEVPWSLFGISIAGYNAIFAAVLGLGTGVAASRMWKMRWP